MPAHQTPPAERSGQQRKKADMAQTQRARRLVLTGISLALLASGSGLAITHQVMRSHDGRQAVADHAALAGLNALVGADGRLDLSRSEVAANAASTLARSQGFVLATAGTSESANTYSVVLNAPGESRSLVATARYVRPGESLGSSHLAELNARN
jgi:hypothetical protein